MITVVVGRPGMGKSVWLVAEIMRYLRQGYHVYSNVDVRLKLSARFEGRFHYIESLDEVTNVHEGKIVFDEVQTYLNSRNWDKLDIRFQLLLQQHRKRGLDIIGATQSIKRADVVFRELVQRFYRVKKIFSLVVFGKAFGLFYLREFDPDTIESSSGNFEAIGWPWLFMADPFTFALYDTTQEYKMENPIGRRVIEEYVMVEKPSLFKRLISKKNVN